MILASSDNEPELIRDGQIEFLIGLLESSSIEEGEEKTLRQEMEEFSMASDRYEELKEYLFKCQVCPISAGRNYSMTDITRKLNREIL